MLLITCPYCGARSELEFVHAGEAHLVRPTDTSQLTDEELARFLFYRKNTKGVHAERWRHVHGCAKFFNVLRDTYTDEIIATYKIDEKKPDIEATS